MEWRNGLHNHFLTEVLPSSRIYVAAPGAVDEYRIVVDPVRWNKSYREHQARSE